MNLMVTQKVNTYRITTSTFVCGIEVTNGIITKTAPILKAFRYKNILKLMDWLDENYTDSYKVDPIRNA